MRLHVQSEPVHTYRVLYSLLPVNSIVTRYKMEQFFITGDFDSLGSLQDPFEVVGADQPVITSDGNYSLVVAGTNVPSGNPDVG